MTDAKGCGVSIADVPVTYATADRNSVLHITGQEGYPGGRRAERVFRDTKLLAILGDSTVRLRIFAVDPVPARVSGKSKGLLISGRASRKGTASSPLRCSRAS